MNGVLYKMQVKLDMYESIQSIIFYIFFINVFINFCAQVKLGELLIF